MPVTPLPSISRQMHTKVHGLQKVEQAWQSIRDVRRVGNGGFVAMLSCPIVNGEQCRVPLRTYLIDQMC